MKSIEERLRRDFAKICARGPLLLREEHGVRLKKYSFLADVYLWHAFAKLQPGLLDEYKDLLSGRVVEHGHNYGPLLRAVYGSANVPDQQVARESKVLNALDYYCGKHSAVMDDNNATSILANYIQNSGGVTALADKYSSNKNVLVKPSATKVVAQKDGLSEAAFEVKVLETFSEEAIKYYQKNEKSSGSNIVARSASGFKLDLFKKAKGKQVFVATIADPAIVTRALVESFKKELGSVDLVSRSIIETLMTQCLPKSLQSLNKKLRLTSDKTLLPRTGNVAISQLAFRKASKEFVLSHAGSISSVVTVCKLKTAVPFNLKSDLIMLSVFKRSFERNVIAEGNVNLYHFENWSDIRLDADDEIAFALRARAKLSRLGDFSLAFTRILKSTSKSFTQPYVRQKIAAVDRFKLDKLFFSGLSYEILNRWVDVFGSKVSRDTHKVCRCAFQNGKFTFEVVQRDGGKFDKKFEFVHGFGGPARKFSFVFNAADFVTVFLSFANLQPTSVYELRRLNEGLLILFSTDAGSFRVLIPSCNFDGFRSPEHVCQYEPTRFKPVESKYVSE